MGEKRTCAFLVRHPSPHILSLSLSLVILMHEYYSSTTRRKKLHVGCKENELQIVLSPSGAAHTSSKSSSQVPRNHERLEERQCFVTTKGITPDHMPMVKGFIWSIFLFLSVSIDLAWQSAAALNWYVRQCSNHKQADYVFIVEYHLICSRDSRRFVGLGG